MTAPPAILGLYFYRAAHPVAGPEANFDDSSCRPDPDFDHGTLGLCRPGLRSKTARLARDYGPVELLFYAYGPDDSSIALVALMRVEESFRDHHLASASFSTALPPNLMLQDNPCLLGTVINGQTGRLRPKVLPGGCSCDYYVARAQTTYIKFDTKTSVVRRDNPVLLAFRDLVKLAPHGIGSRWPRNLDISTFNRGTQNGARWLRESSEVVAVREHFLNAGANLQHGPSNGARRTRSKPLHGQRPLNLEAVKRPARKLSC